MLKRLALGGVIPACAVPVTVATAGRKVDHLEDIDVPKSSVRGFISSIKRDGYVRRRDNQLAEFDTERKTYKGRVTGLGCHRTLFRGKNYLKFEEPKPANQPYLTNKKFDIKGSGTIIACSAAAVRTIEDSNTAAKGKASVQGQNNNNKNQKKKYEFEFAFKREDHGFIEKIVITNERISSQLTRYEVNKDNHTRIQYPYVNAEGFQRYIQIGQKVGETKTWKIANPESGTWEDFDLDARSGDNQAIYYSVWVEGNNGRGIFDNLGIKSRSDDKWFSSVVEEYKTQNENKWFSYFTAQQDNNYNISPHRHQDKSYAFSALSPIATVLSKTKGSWREIKSFCNEHKNEMDVNTQIGDRLKTQLKEYCYYQPSSAW